MIFIKQEIQYNNMKTLYSCILAILFLLPIASAASVSRTVSPPAIAPGGTVTVTLSVDVSGAPDYYAIDEMFPSGWTVIDKGEGSIEHSGHWKYVVIENAQNTQLSYTLRAPQQEGTYQFTGEYMFGGMQEEVAITGQSTVAVSSSTMDWTVILIALVAVVLVAFFSIATVRPPG